MLFIPTFVAAFPICQREVCVCIVATALMMKTLTGKRGNPAQRTLIKVTDSKRNFVHIYREMCCMSENAALNFAGCDGEASLTFTFHALVDEPVEQRAAMVAERRAAVGVDLELVLAPGVLQRQRGWDNRSETIWSSAVRESCQTTTGPIGI